MRSFRDWHDRNDAEIMIVGILALAIGAMVWAYASSNAKDAKEVKECKSPALVNTVYGGRWVGVQYVYSCEGGNVIQVSNPINGAKVPR